MSWRDALSFVAAINNVRASTGILRAAFVGFIPFLFRKWMIRFICVMFNFLLFYNEPNQCVFNSAFHRPILRSNNDQSTLRQTYLLLCCKMNWSNRIESNQSNYLHHFAEPTHRHSERRESKSKKSYFQYPCFVC